MKNKPNPQFFYRGNDIVKLWEQYLKQNLDNENQNVKFYTENEIANSIFSGLSQQKEIAIILNENGTLYRNKDQNTIALCGEVDYTASDIQKKVKAAKDLLESYNICHEDKITDHIILFPYHVSRGHWNLGVIELKVTEENIFSNCTIAVYEPYGGQAKAENYILEQINLLFPASNTKKVIHKKQQNDGSSCGAITAENGKEFLKKEVSEPNLLAVDYPRGAEDLRIRHIEQINEEAFNRAQIEDRAYEARGDKSIENQLSIIELLGGIIEESTSDWVKQVLPLTQDQDDLIRRQNLDLFKEFLIQQSISETIKKEVINSILREDGGFQEGAIDLISTLTDKVKESHRKTFISKKQSSISYTKPINEKMKSQEVRGFYSETDVMVLIEALLARAKLKRDKDGRIDDSSQILAPKRTILDSGDVSDAEVSDVASEILKMHPKQQILIPVIIPSKTHWVTLQIRCYTSGKIHLRCYDSIGNRYEQEMFKLCDLLRTKLPEKVIAVGEVKTPAIQKGNVYCGGYTARLINNLVISKQPVYANIDIWNCRDLKDKDLRTEDLQIVNEIRPFNWQKFGNPDLLSAYECKSNAEQGSLIRTLTLQDKQIQIRKELKTSTQEQLVELQDTLNLIDKDIKKLTKNEFWVNGVLGTLRKHKLDHNTILRKFIFRLDELGELIRTDSEGRIVLAEQDGDSTIQDDLEIEQIQKLLEFTLLIVKQELGNLTHTKRELDISSGKVRINEETTKPVKSSINEKMKSQIEISTKKANKVDDGRVQETLNQGALLNAIVAKRKVPLKLKMSHLAQLKLDSDLLELGSTLEEDDDYYDINTDLDIDIENEETFKDDQILYYANKTGLLPVGFNPDQDLVLLIGVGIDQKQYVYNHQSDTLRCNDSFGTRYYNKSDKEREKLLLIYELKKLYLNKKEKESEKKLQEGNFYDATLVVEDDSSHKQSLEEKIRYIDKIIDILDAPNPNYGRSFGEQIDTLIKILQDLNNFSDELNKIEWDSEVIKFINESFFENIRLLKALESNAIIVLDDKEEKQHQFIIKCVNLVQSKDYTIENVEQLKICPEYSDLTKARAEEFFGGLIRDIQHKILSIRKEQIEKELNKTKLVEQEIRKKQEQIRKTKGEFSEEYQISEKDEERYARLLKAQKTKTNNEYREGLGRTKELAEEDGLRSGIRHSKYDLVSEERDVIDITQTIDKEQLRIKAKEEYIANKRQEVVDLREDRIPTLEEERDLLPIIVTGLDNKLKGLNELTKDFDLLERQTQRDITRIEADNGRDEITIKGYYQTLSNLLTEIERLKVEIKRLKTAKAAVRGEEESAFKERIFVQVGGQRSDNYSPDGYCNHKSCPATLPGETKCQYKNAVKDAVSFSINKFPSLASRDELLSHLSAYKHSAVGDAVHQADLLMIPRHVYDSYTEVQNKIRQREEEYQHQITQNESTQQRKEIERNNLRVEIIRKENVLNDNNIILSAKEREKDRITLQGDSDSQVNFITDSKDILTDQHSFINGEIAIKEEEISELVLNIAEKREEINELETEIYKEGEYNQALVLSEARWKYSQYEKIVTNIGDLEKQQMLQERLEIEKNTVDTKLAANKSDKDRLNTELEYKTEEIHKNLLYIEELIQEKNDLIATRSLYETESLIGLVNTIEICRKDIKKIKKQQASEIKAMNKAKASIIRRGVYKILNLKQKGTTKTDENDPEDIGTENQLYKKRRHKNCQNVFEKENQACKYFDAVDIIIKILLEEDSKSNVDASTALESKHNDEPDRKSNEEIFAELESKHEHYKNHVLIKHKVDITNIIQVTRNKIREFNRAVQEIKDKYTNEQVPIDQLIDTTRQKLREKKKLDGVVVVKNLASETEEQDIQNIQANLDIGVDCVVIDQRIIYTLKKSPLTIDQFVEEITSGDELSIDAKQLIKQEALKFLTSRKPISLEAVLLQKKDTDQKAFYKLLVKYFDKEYLKKKLEIIEQIGHKALLESEIRDIRRDIARIDREDEKLRNINSNLELNLDFNSKEIKRLNLEAQVLDTLRVIEGNDIKDFKQMKLVYSELLEFARKESEDIAETIRRYTQEVKDLKNRSKSVECSQDSLYEIKPRILKNRFKIGLKSKEQKHRDCDSVCDFFQRVATLIDYTIEDIQQDLIILRAPEYKVSKENQNRLIARLNIGNGHSKKHEQAFRRVISYVAEEYGQAREKAQIKHNNKIKQLEWKISKLDSEKDASNQILIQELIKRIAEIDSFFVFRKDVSFIGKSSGNGDITEKELIEYQEEKFKELFRSQVDYLIIIFERLNLAYESENNKNIPAEVPTQGIWNQFTTLVYSRIQYIRGKPSTKTTVTKKEISPIIQCLHHVFKDYYDDLDSDHLLILQLISKLRQELTEENPESKIKSLIKKRTTQTGGIEYILKKISWIFQQDLKTYNKELDPEQIYHQILLEEREKREKIEEKTLDLDNNNLNLEELEYYIDYIVEASQEIYELVNNISKNLNKLEGKSEQIELLSTRILSKADEIELRKTSILFQDRINYQEKQHREILAIKDSIIKNFSKYCGILDKTNRENYTRIIKLYLNKLDRLVAEGNKEDISYVARKQIFEDLKQSVDDIIGNEEIDNNSKAERIESKISSILSELVLESDTVSDLPVDIVSHLSRIIDGSLETESNYKRKTQTVQIIKLEDLFDNSGRVKEKQGKEVFVKNKTVIVNIDQEEYYRLSEDINALATNPVAYEKAIEEYRNELSLQYRRYKLVELTKTIENYNSNKDIKNLINLTKNLVYYFTLREEHLQSDEILEDVINQFLQIYHNTIKCLMINDKCDQEVILELRIALDLFNEDVIQERLVSNKEENGLEKDELRKELISNLKLLRTTLTYKTYKESGFKLFTEEENQFKQQLAQNNFLTEKLNEVLEEKIPEIIWLRSFIIPERSELFFESFYKLANEVLSDGLSDTNSDNIQEIQRFIYQEKNKIVLAGLIDEVQLCNVDDFIKKIVTKELLWEDVLSNPNITDQNKFQKLSFIIEEHHLEFSQEIFEALIIELSKKEECADLDSFILNILGLYINKVLADKKETLNKTILNKEKLIEKLTVILEDTIINAFKVLQIVKNTQIKKSYKEFIRHLNQLTQCIPDVELLEDNFQEVEASLSEKQIKFITDIFDISEPEHSIFTEIAKIENTEKTTYLKLLLQLPDVFYTTNREEYKVFIEELAQSDILDLPDLHYYIKENIYRYYDLFLDNILDSNPDTEDLEKIKSDIQEVLRRLYNNIPVVDFIRYAGKWLKLESVSGSKPISVFHTITNSVFQSCSDFNLSSVLEFLYNEEKEHLKALLNFIGIKQKSKSNTDEDKRPSQALNKEITQLWNQYSKQLSEDSVIDKIRNFFTKDDAPPIIMWAEELIDLRLDAIRDLILSDERLGQDHGTTKISDILDAFRFFHEEKGNLNIALDLLDLICSHLEKFTTLEEIKQSIYSLLQVENLTIATNIIKYNNTKSVTLDLLFSQIDAGNNKKLKNALDKLKLILSSRAFKEINYFCKIFILQMREQQNLDNLHNIIDLIIESKAYIRPDFLRDLQDKNLSSWSAFLEKALILNELDATSFNQCRNKDKGKTVNLLYQIKEEKGKNLQQILLGKIKNLDKDAKDSRNIKKLNFILNKIIYKQYKSEAIETLSSQLSEWEEILFSSTDSKSTEVLTIKQLLSLMTEEDKINDDGINSSIKDCLQNLDEGDEALIERLLKDARNLNKKSKIYDDSNDISKWQEQEIKAWAKSFKDSSKHNELFLWRTAESIETVSEVISVIIRAVMIYDHHPKGPRDTQLMSLLLFLDNNKKGRLGNVYTGEGKTLITVMLATCLGLIGKKVDIVTSSKVLAVRDSKTREPGTKEGYKGFFEMFDLKASNNCDEECEKADTGEQERKSRYESCNIIYGEAGYFQRDILLSQFFSKDIRGGSGIGDVLILDEVDSMMIDNAAKTLYISHNITDMRHLRDVFIHIWAAVNTREERYYSEENVKKIIKYINKIIGNVESKSTPPQEEDFKVLIPSTLYDFVQMNLKTWIESAYDAKYIGEDDAYIIGDADSQKQNEVIIMDKDTGVEQTSTKWSNGLHQFIQLKHSGKLSDESLKAVYISNVGYFQSYPNLYGMTGTVGGTEERRLLSDVYGIDFFEMPRFKEYRFEYDFESESVAGTSEEWLNNIVANIDENMDQQLPYTTEYITSMKQRVTQEKDSLAKLTRDYDIYNSTKQDLNSEQEQFQEKIKIFEAIEKASDEIIQICTKPVLDSFKINIKRIRDQITTLKQFCKDRDSVEKIGQFFSLIPEFSDDVSEYIIEQFGIRFKEQVKEMAITDLNNQVKEKLEKLNTVANKIQEEIDYICTAKEASQKALEFYDKESQAEPGNQRQNSRRAILIICDSISDLKLIEDRVRKTFDNSNEYKIYTYDRAYKKFDVSSLEAGDIVIATNIAGRGTDLEVSKLAEENGGLHVILSYMPKNSRIEKQAFGRTARAGNKGTATYIVFDPRKQSEDIDISYLKQERNDIESSRLVVVQKEQLPKIKLEDKLFIEFNKLRQSIESILENRNKLKQQNDESQKLLTSPQKKSRTPLTLQIDSLKNKWAIWLNKMSDKFNKVHETGSDEILREFELFKREINSKLDNKYGLIEEPGELNALGRVYLDNEQYSEALDCFDYIIDKHSSFASIALYYKAFCIIHKEGGGFDAKIKAKVALKKSLMMLEDDRSRILSRNQILKSINEVARSRGKGLESNCFAKQNEGEAQVLSVHINAINSAIGSEISPDCFNAPGIIGDQSQKLFDELLKDKYGIIKDFRISKKCVIASKVLIQDHAEQERILQQKKLNFEQWLEDYKALPKLPETYPLQKPSLELANYDNAIKFITTHDDSYITYKNEEYETYQKILQILENTKIISERQLFKKTDNLGERVTDTELIAFPDVFQYCKEQVLDDLMRSLTNSQKQSWDYKHREIQSSSFETAIYTKKKFIEDTATLIKVEEVIKIAGDISQKLLGQLDHPVFCDHGDMIKDILTSELLTIDHAFLEQRLKDVKNEAMFFGKKAEIQEFCLGRRKIVLGSDKTIELLDNQSFAKDEVIAALKKIIDIAEESYNTEQNNFNSLLMQLGFNVGGNIFAKHQLVQVIRDKTSLKEEQINYILTHLEVYEKLSVDHTFLEQRFKDVKNEAIFFGKKAEIQEFCLGRRKIVLSGDKIIELLDNQSFAKDEIVAALRKIVQISDSPSLADKTNFDALLIQLGFQEGIKFEAINSYNRYGLKDATQIDKIKEYLEVINLKDSNTNEDTIYKLDFSVDTRLAKKSDKITEILKANIRVDKPLKKEDFALGEEEFGILRAILTDANVITTSIFNLLMNKENQENINLELETILMRIYQADGVITDQDIVLKDAKEGSKELFNRLRELHIIKPPKVNFKLGRAKYVPEFCGGNALKESSDPLKRIEYIKNRIERVVQDVFKLERQNDAAHEANEYFTGGIGTESKNKELDEKIETITNIIKNVVGTIKTLPEIKVSSKDLRTMFSEGKVPPELMDYIHICFDAVLEYKEDKGFDWDCFLCAMIGLAQIVAGVALEVLSGGSAHFIAQSLIAEGVGDIVFAIQASVEGNFSWKSYGQHKVQSLMMSLVTAGVGGFLSKGTQAGKFAVGLATKTAITKAIMKTIVVEACTAVVTAGVNVGTEEISKLLIEEIANTHFVQYFEKWIQEDSAYHQKTLSIENKLNVLYDKFGSTIAKQSIETCIESALNQLLSGALGDKIFAQISRVVGGITKGFSMAAKSLGKGNSKAKLLGAVASFVEKTVKVAEFSKNFAQLCSICNDFHDHLVMELARLEVNLIEQQKAGTLKIDEKQIAQEKVAISFSGEASKDLRNMQQKMHVAFKAKIKNGFLQPAVSSLLHMAVKPIQQMITAPFADAMDQLKDHIDSRSEMFQIAIMNQHADTVVPITARQKKALEARGEIIKIEDIKDPGFLKAEVANFTGETLENLQKEHGANLNVLIRDGKIYAVLPTYKQLCSNIQNSNLKLAGELHIKMAATQVGRNIEVVSADIDGSKTLIHHEKGPGAIEPIGGPKSGKESLKVAFIEGEGGKPGHYAPVIKDQDGNWKVVKDIIQTPGTKDACFAQTMAYLKEYEKNGNLGGAEAHERAKVHAQDPAKVIEYNKSLGKFAKHNKAIKSYYLQGTTVKKGRMIGGLEVKTYDKPNGTWDVSKKPVEGFCKAISEQLSKLPNHQEFVLYGGAAIAVHEESLKELGIEHAAVKDLDFRFIGEGDIESRKQQVDKLFSQKNFFSNSKWTSNNTKEGFIKISGQWVEFSVHLDNDTTKVKTTNVEGLSVADTSVLKYAATQKYREEQGYSNDKRVISFTRRNSTTLYASSALDPKTPFIHQMPDKRANQVERIARLIQAYKNRPHSGIINNKLYKVSNISPKFYEYTVPVCQSILDLRLKRIDIKEVCIQPHFYIFTKEYNNISNMLMFVINNISQIILIPFSLYGRHIVGLMFIKQLDNSIRAFYIDPENKIISKTLENIFVAFGIIVKQVSVEEQRYTNCGPEVIENFIYYLTGTRATQEGAVYVHSLLLENTLLDPVEYALKISENNKLIRFLSNQELIIDRPVMSTDRLKKITMFTDGYITESFFSGRKHYTNYSLEVKEKFILYMTREHLAQQDGIFYNSRLVEQEFITHNGSTIEHCGKTVNKGYFMHMLAKDYVSGSVFTNETTSAEVSLVDEMESLQHTKLIESSNEDHVTEVVTLNNGRTSNTLEQKHLEEIDLAGSSCEQIAEVVGLQQEEISIDDKEVRTNIDNGNRLYLRATKLFEEGWLAEASEDEDASLIAKSRFAEAIQLYAEAMNLDPFNIVYRQAFNITSLKIDGNSFFNEGVELADLAYQLEEELLSEEKGNIEDYDVIINKYRDVIRIYQVAHDKFAEGLILSQDIRFESCMELVNQSIKNIQEAIDQLENEKLDIETLVDVTEYDTEELGLVSKKPVIRMDGPYIELFANSNEHGASESVLIGSNYTPDYYLSM